MKNSSNHWGIVCVFVVVAMFVGCAQEEGTPHMDPVFSKLFSDANDFHLIDGLAVAISDSEESDLCRPQKIVRTIWHADGIIGNGGFEACFYANLSCEDLLDALDRIGAHESATAVKQALSVFPNSNPPAEMGEREEFLTSLTSLQVQTLSSSATAFSRDQARRVAKLGDYVRSHKLSFSGLESGWVAQEYVEQLVPTPTADATPREIATWILSLGGHIRFSDLNGSNRYVNRVTSLPGNEILISEIGLPTFRRDINETLSHITTLRALQNSLVSISFNELTISPNELLQLSKLPSLREVDLSETDVSDLDLALIAKLPLTSISLRDTKISDSGVAHLEALSSLEKLELSSTRVTTDCLDSLIQLPRLVEIEFPKSLLIDENMDRIVRLRQLTHLYAAGSELTDKGLAQIAKLENLESLTLDSCIVTDAGLVAVSKLSKLKHLQLRYTKTTDQGLRHLETLSSLKELDLNSTAVSDVGMASISQLTNLNALHLDSTQVTDSGMANLESLKGLEVLSLYETAVGDMGMASVAKLTNLVDLSISGTQVTDEGFAKLAALKNLRELGFRDTAVTNKSIPVILEFSQLRRFHTSDFFTSEEIKTLKQALDH